MRAQLAMRLMKRRSMHGCCTKTEGRAEALVLIKVTKKTQNPSTYSLPTPLILKFARDALALISDAQQ